jgi:hypothetical protein
MRSADVPQHAYFSPQTLIYGISTDAEGTSLLEVMLHMKDCL